MERFRLDKFIKAYQHASAMNQTWLTARDHRPELQSVRISSRDHGEFVENLATLSQLLSDAGLSLSAMSASAALESANEAVVIDGQKVLNIGPMLRLSADIKDLQTRVRDEFVTRYALIVPTNKVPFYEPLKPPFGSKVETSFESVNFDISESGKCFGLGRYTSCVFHLMRVLETGIRAIARCLGVSDPVKEADRNWGKMLRNINDAINAKKVVMSAYDTDLFNGAYVALDKVRSLWRNPTMHVGNKYSEDEAKEIWDAVSIFMRKLASRMDENGAPQV